MRARLALWVCQQLHGVLRAHLISGFSASTFLDRSLTGGRALLPFGDPAVGKSVLRDYGDRINNYI